MAVAAWEMTARVKRYNSVTERIEANIALCWPKNPGPEWDGTPCELWTGPRNGSGYPRMSQRCKAGKRKGKVVQIAVHRHVIGLTKKRNKEAMHLCNEQLCTKRSHLKPGTSSENKLYQVLSGTHNSIEREPGSD